MGKKREFWRTVKFGLFSASAGIIQIGTFALLNELTPFRYWPCYLISLVLSVLWNFTLNRKFTFQSASNVPVAMLKVLGYYLVFTPVSTIGGNYLVKTLGWNEYLVTGLNMALNLITEYLFQRFVVYGKTVDTNKRVTLELKKGSTVPFPEKLVEAYEMKENHICANIGTGKIEDVLRHFIGMHEEPQFFILELPTNLKEERKIGSGMLEQHHKDVYYIDGCDQEKALAILARVGDMLINDGLSSFGFGCHESGDEILFGKYNVTTVFSRNIAKYETFFQEHGIPRTEKLVTAWDTFSFDHPGDSKTYKANGKTVYDIPELFKDWGIYFAERREDD